MYRSALIEQLIIREDERVIFSTLFHDIIKRCCLYAQEEITEVMINSCRKKIRPVIMSLIHAQSIDIVSCHVIDKLSEQKILELSLRRVRPEDIPEIDHLVVLQQTQTMIAIAMRFMIPMITEYLRESGITLPSNEILFEK